MQHVWAAPVVDYRTHVFRINPWFLQAARTSDVVQVDIVTLFTWENIGWTCNKKQSGHFATRPFREERLRREPLSSLL